jgi:ABC-type amino acid transport substrate-binding protein
MEELLLSLGVRDFDAGIPSGGAPAALRSGRIQATVSGIEDALLYRLADPEIQIGGFVGPPASLAFGVRKDSPRLKAALDEHVASLRRTPTWHWLIVRYFGEAAPILLKGAQGR